MLNFSRCDRTIGYTVSEYDYQFGVMNIYEDDEFEDWLKDNTYLDELQEVAKIFKNLLVHKLVYFSRKIFKRFCKEDYPKNYRPIFRYMVEGYQGEGYKLREGGPH